MTTLQVSKLKGSVRTQGSSTTVLLSMPASITPRSRSRLTPATER